MYFVVQKKHNKNTNAWDNNIITKENENEKQAEYDALHQFHAFMSTYGYGFDNKYDFVSAEIQTRDGRCVKNETDDRLNETAEPEVEE